MPGKVIPRRVDTVNWARAAFFNPYRCPISSSVFANLMAFSKSSIARLKLPRWTSIVPRVSNANSHWSSTSRALENTPSDIKQSRVFRSLILLCNQLDCFDNVPLRLECDQSPMNQEVCILGILFKGLLVELIGTFPVILVSLDLSKESVRFDAVGELFQGLLKEVDDVLRLFLKQHDKTRLCIY